MSNLNDANRFDDYESHPGKPLKVHTAGVTNRVEARTSLEIARIAAKLHDVGKINPNFQKKLNNNKLEALFATGTYSSHAYLSVLAFLAIPKEQRASLLGLNARQSFSVAMLIALHHGNLRNCKHHRKFPDKIEIELGEVLKLKPYDEAVQFVRACPQMPLVDFASHLLNIELPFEIKPADHPKIHLVELREQNALNFFMETQFAFASLVESDKRDAGDNNEERREINISGLSAHLAMGLEKPFVTEEEPSDKTKQLNEVRTQIRTESLQNIADALAGGEERIFCLNAPTGAGKTLTLLALANAILHHRSTLQHFSPALKGIIYCLPFLSITEQVEIECQKLIGDDTLILRADSSANHPQYEALLAKADNDPQAAEQLLREDFAEQIFDCPLVITTFVQFFETLMSNRNATLLKLPNFARSIIVIDEVQALPPRLYVFFAAYLAAFCREFDSYVLFSTATMPQFALPEDKGPIKPKSFFSSYQEPRQLIATEHFDQECFQRYTIEPHWDISSLEVLKTEVKEEARSGSSIMVVLNTIRDTRALYRLLNPDENPNILLLNTCFIPADRREKVERCRDLDKKPPLILITTQLIEAGVDIDFPIVFRDLCPFPNLVQTAGRCNRHNTLSTLGRVVLIDLKDEKSGKSRAETIYLADVGNWYLDFTRKAITASLNESDLFVLQAKFFEKINENLIFGYHPGLRDDRDKSNLLHCIRDAAFEDAGKFKLIQEEGEQYAFYIPNGRDDKDFERLQELSEELAEAKKKRDFKLVSQTRIAVEAHLRQMRQRVVQARMKQEKARQLGPGEPVMGIYELGDSRNYTRTFGLEVAEDDQFF